MILMNIYIYFLIHFNLFNLYLEWCRSSQRWSRHTWKSVHSSHPGNRTVGFLQSAQIARIARPQGWKSKSLKSKSSTWGEKHSRKIRVSELCHWLEMLADLWEGELVERHADTLLAALQGGRALWCVQCHRLAALNHDTILVRTEEEKQHLNMIRPMPCIHVCILYIHTQYILLCILRHNPRDTGRIKLHGEKNQPAQISMKTFLIVFFFPSSTKMDVKIKYTMWLKFQTFKFMYGPQH